MPDLPSLLERFAVLHRQHVEIEHEIAAVESEIRALTGAQRPRRQRATPAEIDEQILSLLKALQEAPEPLPPSEIAARLGADPVQVSHRLRQAIGMGFVQKVGNGRYVAVGEIPAL